MTEPIQYLDDVLGEQLARLYGAEVILARALPEIFEHISNPECLHAMHQHHSETREQVLRLERAFVTLGLKLPESPDCPVMGVLIREGIEILSRGQTDANLLDIQLISLFSRIEQYEIAAYTSALLLGEALGQAATVELFERSLEEEEAMNEALAILAEEDVISLCPTKDSGQIPVEEQILIRQR